MKQPGTSFKSATGCGKDFVSSYKMKKTIYFKAFNIHK